MSRYCPKCNSDFSDAFDECVYCGELLNDGINPNPKEFELPWWCETNNTSTVSNKNTNIPHCPICNSTNLEKISAANKVGSVAVFGVLAVSHVGKTYKCKNCGSKF